MKACLSARTVGQNHFNHCGGPVKLVQACVSAKKGSFHHCVYLVKLVQGWF